MYISFQVRIVVKKLLKLVMLYIMRILKICTYHHVIHSRFSAWWGILPFSVLILGMKKSC